MTFPSDRPWWRKKRWAAALAVWMALAYPLSVGPFDYAANRRWLPPALEAAGDPLYAPYRWALHPENPRPGLGWLVDYDFRWIRLAQRHRAASG